MFYGKRDEVVFLLTVLAWCLDGTWTSRRECERQSSPLGEMVRVCTRDGSGEGDKVVKLAEVVSD